MALREPVGGVLQAGNDAKDGAAVTKFLGIKGGRLIFDDRKVDVRPDVALAADKEAPALSADLENSNPGAKVYVHVEDGKVGAVGVLFRGRVSDKWWKGRHGDMKGWVA